ncbi:hypothetical protein NPX13_g2334 [Xylaria arbuscula]|uniref:Uncharacterized protein n=1 Tax=Xylaria arbuscula TaxID=114810 RepID=A0A9W8TQI8_9PEZI|nr:hypothetical protein NPX13_g2334 [Xylaria arbuscula]
MTVFDWGNLFVTVSCAAEGRNAIISCLEPPGPASIAIRMGKTLRGSMGRPSCTAPSKEISTVGLHLAQALGYNGSVPRVSGTWRQVMEIQHRHLPLGLTACFVNWESNAICLLPASAYFLLAQAPSGKKRKATTAAPNGAGESSSAPACEKLEWNEIDPVGQ